MKKIILSVIAVTLVLSACYFLFFTNSLQEDTSITMEQRREKHEQFLNESPFKTTKDLSKKERKALGLPPNAYNERMWELTMNPDLGYPTPFLVDPIDVNEIQAKTSPGSAKSAWVERGPSNIGGRTRVVFFDPNDVGPNNGDGVDFNKVYAGGVGGGLWVNNNIEDELSEWQIVPGLAANLSVSCYAIDPNDSNVIYIGTGEQYTSGAAIGTGLYKSTDGGTTWQSVAIPVLGSSAESPTTVFKAGIFHINDIVARNNNGSTELYVGVGSSRYSSPNFNFERPEIFLGIQNSGLYRSIDNGLTWEKNEDPALFYGSNDFPIIPNDLEIGADNQLYMGSISTPGFGLEGGGRILTSTDGIAWTEVTTIDLGDRIELSASNQNANKLYVLSEINAVFRNGEVVDGEVSIFSTVDKFGTLTALPEPEDADQGIPEEDFTRGQAFYDLVIEVNPQNDAEVYVGGINMHRSRNSGQTWSQISKWSENPNMDVLNIPYVHADIHAVEFKPGDPGSILVGSDGGVSWGNTLLNPGVTPTSIQTRILGYNVTQYYYGDIDQNISTNGDNLLGGTQDNGSPVIYDSTVGGGLTPAFDPLGGDGSFTEIDDEGEYVILGYTSRNHFRLEYPITETSGFYTISRDNDGDFINVATLDSRNDIFYANSRTTTDASSITACTLGETSATCEELTGSNIASGRATALKASPFQTATPVLYIGTQNSRLFLVTNSNSNTNKIITNISGPGFLGSVSDIEFGETALEIYVTMHNYGVNNIWYTDNGGSTWTAKDGNLPDIPVKAILANPLVDNEVIIGTQSGVYSTTDFDSPNPTWTISMNGMTNVPVYDLDLRTADNTVLATTHGRGMFTGKFDSSTASISRQDSNQLLKLFPTQARSEVFLTSDINMNNVDVIIYNLNGKEVYRDKKSITSDKQRIDVSALSTGFYILKAKGKDINQTVKFIKE